MTERTCKYCEGEVTSTNPAIAYCRECYYAGTWLFDEPSFRPLLDDLGGAASPAHTGGGCFVIEIINGATFLWASQDGDAGLPETADGPWWLFQYQCDSSIDPILLGEHLDRAGLIAAKESACTITVDSKLLGEYTEWCEDEERDPTDVANADEYLKDSELKDDLLPSLKAMVLQLREVTG